MFHYLKFKTAEHLAAALLEQASILANCSLRWNFIKYQLTHP